MEFVGKTVRKEFKGFGVFSGVVNSYDSSTGFFEVLYEDGDSEELELSEIASLLEGSGTIVNDGQSGAAEVTRVGRKPRKRRRFQTHGDSGNASANLMSDRCLKETGEEIQLGFCGVGGNLRETHSVNGNLNFSSGCNGIGSNNLLNLNDGFDLNNELSLNDGFNLNGGFNSNEGNLKKNGFIDLNLDANGDFEENLEEGDSRASVGGTQKREHCFDLNLGLDTDFEGQLVENNSFYVVDKTPKLKMCGGIEKVRMEGNSRNGEGTQTGAGCRPCGNAAGDLFVGLEEEVPKESGGSLVFKVGDSSGAMHAKDFMSSEVQTRETNSDTGTPLEHGSQENLESACKERKRRKRRKPVDGINNAKEGVLRRGSSTMEVAVSAENHVLSGVMSLSQNVVSPPGAMDAKDFLSSEVQVEEGFSDGTTLDHGYGGNSGSTRKETYGRKKRKLLDNVNSATGKVLRRSSRRLAASLYGQNHVSSEAQPSPAVSEILEESPSTIVREESEEDSVLPSKLPLPPSSKNLNLDGIPIFDLFSVYACLRSFSSSLFLSPFELEDFVASLQCNVPTLLLDSVHVCLLQTMRRHLEFLSDENSKSASDCLRSLNWDMLDLITWPMFMVEYLIMHGSRLMPAVDLCKLKLFESEYYKQPVSVKIEILRCLCDDVVEVEAIRSELNRRTLAIELNIDTDRSMRIETFKRRTSMDVSGGSCLSEEVVEGTTDWNSDECCLCKMDGNLICCDGCPEAYHLRCLGVTNSALPEGDWYCPECRIDRDKPWLKLGKSLRGAELLGVDPYGRLYYSSCGYLLVSDSCDDEPSYRYYSRNDLTSVIEALKSFDTLYSPILGAISKQWNVFISSTGANSHVDYNNPIVCSELVLGQMPSNLVLPLHLAPSETCVRNEIIDEGKPQVNYIAAQYSGNIDSEVSASVDNNPVTVNNFVKMENPLTSSEGSAATSQATRIQSLAKTGTDGFNLSAGGSNHFEIQGKLISDSSLTSTDLDAEQGKNIKSADCGHIASMTETKKVAISQGLLRIGYVNYYSFARTASLVAEELTRRSSGKINVGSTKPVEDIILAQLKAISKKATKFYWPNLQNPNVDTRKEKCGWCFSCKAPDEDRDCFFNMNESAQDLPCEAVGLRSKWNKKGHHVDVMCYILCLEDRLRGFLLGPWLNPHYTDLWRKSVVKASDVASLKHLLLVLESNLRPLALSAEWLKHVDSVATVGSASHVVTSSKYGIGRKRARYSDSDPQPSLKAAAGLGLFWWRGGRLSRDLFNWKVLPRSLASKAARQAGCTKIPGVLYPDSSESTNRSKYIVWRAAVERSRSVEQLALQVRELDANIRWDDIENTNLLSKMDQFRKSVRPFKKVIIRRKCTEGTVMKYLLDFGKRRIIPDIVVTHGSKVEESSSGRKKYWLEEPHVPLHLLKAFEERRIARKSNKMSSGKLHASCGVTKKTSKGKGFSYLFEKAERSENYQCGHCNKDVLIREAVSCQYCKGFFHKRHARKSTRANTANCKYTCHKCQGGNHVKVEGKKGISLSQKSKAGSAICRVLRSSTRKKASKDKKPAEQQKKHKDAVAIPLRRSARRLAHVSLQNKKLGGNKKGKGKGKGQWERKGKGKQIKLRNRLLEKSEKGTWQKKRTQVYRAYWLNGLLLSRKPNDDRVVNFRSKNLVAPLEELTAIPGQPKCSLCCEQEFSSVSNYVSCQICGDWFHGDAFGLSVENIRIVIGFMCHKCRNRTPPVCPNSQRNTSDEAQFGELNEKAGIDCAEEVSKIDEFHMDEESNYRCLVDECSHEDQELETVSNLSQANSKNEHLLKTEEQKGNAIPIPNANEHVLFVESTTDMVTGET